MPSSMFTPSFASGILSPALWGRIDLQKYDSGLRKAKNMIVHAHGGISNRPGTRFICEVMDSSKRHRLVPFSRDVDDTAVLIFGEKQMGVIKNGSRIRSGGSQYTIDVPWSSTQAQAMDYVQSIDVLFVAERGWAPRKIERYADNDWRVRMVEVNPTVPVPTITSATLSGDGSAVYRYCVTAIVDGVESFRSPIVATNPGAALSGGGTVTLNFSSVAGASEYRVYRTRNSVPGYIGFTTGTSFGDDNISPDLTVTPPVETDLFSTPGNFPSVVSIYQQRLAFAASINDPETIWLSRAGDYSNFTRSTNFVGTDRSEFNMSGESLNRVRSLLQLRELLVFTSAGEWSVTGPEGGFDATNPIVTRYGYVGSSTVKPIVADDTALFIDRSGRNVRDLRYAYETDGYAGNDLSIFASHLFDGRTIVDWALAKNPWSLIWVVLSDGKLLAFTYKREHQVWAWTEMEIDGAVESVASVTEGAHDATYLIVRREIQGKERRYVERFDERDFRFVRDSYFVDCGLTYEGGKTDTITGLGHLEGRKVVALADGNVVQDLTVKGGKVILPFPAGTVQVGLPYTCEMENLPPAIDLQGVGSTRGRPHKISKVRLQVERTRGIKLVAPNGKENELVQTGGDLAAQIPISTGMLELTTSPYWGPDGTVTLRQDYPLPMTVLAISPEISIGTS